MATFLRLKTKACNIIGSLNVTDHATELGEWANEAVRDVLVKTGAKVATTTESVSTADHTLTVAALLIKHIYVDGATSDHMLTQVGSGELLEMRVRGTSVSASDGPFYYALEGSDLLRLYPTPSSAATLNITYVPKPTEMSSDSHDPSNATYGGIPVEHHLALELYMLWRAAEQDDDATSDHGERYRQQYEQEIRKIRSVVNRKGGVRLPRARVGRRRYVPSDPSADW